MIFGTRLSEVMEKLGFSGMNCLSTGELAQNLGLSVATLAEWEVAEKRAAERHAFPMIWLL
jgi:hypothetical protein